MRHYDIRILFPLLAALLSAPLAVAQPNIPLNPVITDVRANSGFFDYTQPQATAITAGASDVSLTVTGANFRLSPGAGVISTLVWLPSSGVCPIESCTFYGEAVSATQFIVYLDDTLLATADPGAAVKIVNQPVQLAAIPNNESAPYSVPVNPPMANVTLPQPYLGVPYSAYLTTGGTGPYTFQFVWDVAGPIPSIPGLTVTTSPAGGILVGTPSALGYASGWASFADAWGSAPPSTTYSATVGLLPWAVVGRQYSVASPLVGAGPYTYTLTAGSLPPGIGVTLANQALTIYGAPTAYGRYSADIQIQSGGQTVAAGTIAITVTLPVTITTQYLSPMQPTGTYSGALSAAGGAPPYTWSLVSGSLPAGLTLSPSGAITGTPVLGKSGTFTVAVADSAGSTATATYTLNFVLQMVTQTMDPGKVGVSYSQIFFADGGSGAYVYSLSSGKLPPGFQGFFGNSFSGTPTTPGTYKLTGQLADAQDPAQEPVTRDFTLVIDPATLTVMTASLPDTPVGPVSLPLTAAGGVSPYSWAITAGSAPPGASLTSAGVLSGTTTAPGTYTFTATVTDAAKTIASKIFTIRITPPLLTVTTTSLPPATVLADYSATLGATGGTPPYQWNVDGLPAGLTLDSGTGRISGKPTAPGSFTLALAVTDAAGGKAAGAAGLTVSVAPLTIVSALPSGIAGVPYSTTLTASGGVPPYTWSLAGDAPTGFSLTKDGSLSGTYPSAAVLSLPVRVVDSQANSATAQLSLRIDAAPLQITTASLPNGTAGSPYNQTLTASGGVPPFTWTGTLPAGLTLDANTGTVNGASAAGGASVLAITVMDAAGVKNTKSYSVTFAMPALGGVNLGGIPGSAVPADQPGIKFSLTEPYPLPITGTGTLTFQADSGPDDPNIVFSNGKRTAPFSFPTGSTAAVFSPSSLALQTGTVAGVITLTFSMQSGGMDITPTPAPSKQIRIAPSVPVITSAVATRTSGGFTVQVYGYATTREVSQALFHLSGSNLGSADLAVAVGPLFSSWYAGASSVQFGSQFLYAQTFTVQGDSTMIVNVSVILANSQGQSQSVTAQLK
ncbi:MAG: Ig domain-containing protein [Acidobacteriia bacterium]|nr:Ig domain-containing protein [Terriglobia bacterium]